MACNVTVLTVRSLMLNVLLVFISTIYGVGGFKAAELRITPRVVQRGKNVTMECFHERQNFKPYSVKWYRDTTMFYKFTPMEMPSYRFYEVPGMLIDRLKSNDTHVVLTQVPMSLTGNYSCEVVLQTPGYPVYVAQSRLEVVGAGGLRVKELRIIPPIVQRGSEVTLICLYQLFDAPLYSVKWYRGRHEFFRYTPTETPNTKVFPFAGINVDVARSNGSQAVLTRVTFGLSGNFSCEVTADAPSFATSIVSSHMEVVVLPTQPPIVQTERMHYSSGEVLAANCSSEPSRPQSILAFFINEMPIMPGQLRVQQASEGLFRSELSIAVKLLDHHYKKGAPVLRCESVIGDIYKEYTEIALYAANGDPKIERVTSPGSACQRLKSTLLLIVSIFVCIIRTIKS